MIMPYALWCPLQQSYLKPLFLIFCPSSSLDFVQWKNKRVRRLRPPSFFSCMSCKQYAMFTLQCQEIFVYFNWNLTESQVVNTDDTRQKSNFRISYFSLIACRSLSFCTECLISMSCVSVIPTGSPLTFSSYCLCRCVLSVIDKRVDRRVSCKERMLDSRVMISLLLLVSSTPSLYLPFLFRRTWNCLCTCNMKTPSLSLSLSLSFHCIHCDFD
jgi:hypothetical protein